ncbi:MAG: oxygen-insensitive NADPH nitroreductase [Bifidobacteriaceae bacterium]|jgi:FMN reductase (NADPH)|nr:oxygen-insensitive NADPH nitroreductase [Bifidobacteriaceae bacterium]
MRHASLRSFSDLKLTRNQVETLVRAAQAAASSNFFQAYSIIDITDPELLHKLAKLCGDQPFIAKGARFFVFCADMARNEHIAANAGSDVSESVSGADAFLVASVDVALAAQNMMLAAESMGLGGCYIGGLRESVSEISDLLDIPDHVYPVFGLVLGYPAETSRGGEIKPRLPLNAIYSENRYVPAVDQTLNDYNDEMQRYYERRNPEAEHPHCSWAQGVARSLVTHPRNFMLAFLQERGWLRH